MQFRNFVGLAMLIAAVPLQMYLMKYNENFNNLVADIVKMLPENLQDLTIDLTEYVGTAKGYLRSAYDYFGASKPDEDGNPFSEDDDIPEHTVRNFRPPHLEFRVGDVILTQDMVVGVIIGWSIDMSDLRKEPEYYMLMDNKEYEEFKEVQNQMVGLENLEVRHKNINKYFEKFDGIRYKPKKWLQKMYPKD